ncbi:hypothetical protein HNY73_012916 [Argiope bruennichi]|uniref:Uncharacterized protein n=1 Tax=Argiope bruennichi TaxID=94029 RepID=A0A8T0EY95_ARGBR|nr:hypothetical protein HNY73_012916 [Argiope bruennichi]
MSKYHLRKRYLQQHKQAEVSGNLHRSDSSCTSKVLRRKEKQFIFHDYSETFRHESKQKFRYKKFWSAIKLWNSNGFFYSLHHQEIVSYSYVDKSYSDNSYSYADKSYSDSSYSSTDKSYSDILIPLLTILTPMLTNLILIFLFADKSYSDIVITLLTNLILTVLILCC